MSRRTTLDSYLAGGETTRPQELVFGILREPPAPAVRHQIVVGQIFVRLDRHVRRHRYGRVVPSPVDVILDRERALVVQPDVVFVSTERLEICRDRIWGAPDLVVEVLSPATRWYDRVEKVDWFRQYGVRECWLVEASGRRIEVVDTSGPDAGSRVFEAQELLRSAVLPRLRLRPAALFDE